eukprot:1157490-Pelagomonas_calceolata.AAC.9
MIPAAAWGDLRKVPDPPLRTPALPAAVPAAPPAAPAYSPVENTFAHVMGASFCSLCCCAPLPAKSAEQALNAPPCIRAPPPPGGEVVAALGGEPRTSVHSVLQEG